ncbi:MAG: hypothetical protein EAZ61_12785 [Oscillatoriales cyanobacterium]|jgi:hypothetical protein|nr:MAG: hypothetical protein EAZ61_12785 [Oscillatoriales cyanobacterium]
MREPTSTAAPDISVGGNLYPVLIRIARHTYHTYLDDLERTGTDRRDRPIGVAVDRVSHRATVILQPTQPLLPQEYLVPLHLIDPNDLLGATRP